MIQLPVYIRVQDIERIDSTSKDGSDKKWKKKENVKWRKKKRKENKKYKMKEKVQERKSERESSGVKDDGDFPTSFGSISSVFTHNYSKEN